MLQNIGINKNTVNDIQFSGIRKKNASNPAAASASPSYSAAKSVTSRNVINNVNTTLSSSDKEKYLFLTNLLKDMPISQNAEGMSPNKQLDFLLKNGKLLAKTSRDKSSTLDNLYIMATQERLSGLDNKKLISNTLDILVNPRYVTQNFGDIPLEEKSQIVSYLKPSDEAANSPGAMDVSTSGVCPAASLEVNGAGLYPAEYTRWLAALSSKEGTLTLDLDLKAISKNPLEAMEIINAMKLNREGNFNFEKNKYSLKLDTNAQIRAQIQNKHWDYGERNVADVLIQSAFMQLGSQNTYNALTDTRGGEFSTSSQGLIEIEKTFVESVFKNKEITSLVYQQIDDEQNLVGYTCSFDKIEKHIKDTIDSGDNVILGYVLTNETSGRSKSEYYNPEQDGSLKKVINGHEITIVDYKQDQNGKTVFVCVDTDDDTPNFVEYDANWLLPKIHHAGYPAAIVEADAVEIMKKAEMF